MKRLHKFSLLLVGLFWLNAISTKAQVCKNVSLSFDGNADYVTLSPTPLAVSGNANFTFEAQFTIASPTTICNNNFRRLFALSGQGSPGSRFEVGECNNQLKLYWVAANSTVIPTGVTTISGTLSPGCHHLAVVRNVNSLRFYLNGALLPYNGTLTGPLNTNIFVVGHWAGGATGGQDWQGEVDEIRLWNVPRTATEILDFKDCSLASSSPSSNLVVSWTCDQPGVNPSGNNAGAVLEDMSGNNNDGTFAAVANGFLLNTAQSNFVCSSWPPIYTLNISDYPIQNVSLVAICNGTAVHFCVSQNGQPITVPPSGTTVTWWYHDAGSTIPQMVSNPIFTGFCFGVPIGVIDISAICASSTTGYVDRQYWATISKTPPGSSLTCTYATSCHQLRIYCPVTNASIVLNPVIPTSPIIALCEGTNYATNVSVATPHTFVPSGVAPTGDLSIQWCINGLPIGTLTDMGSFPYSGVAVFPDLCFEAKIQNGVCPLFTTKTCIPVDKVPMCGIIDAVPELALMSDPTPSSYDPYDYLLCPGNDVELMMLNPLDFKDCNAVWQFMFPTVGTWNDLKGTGNSTQNTNILPQLPPNPPSASIWPAGENCILYRIECRPKNYPFSDCTPCHSNTVQVCLKTPKPAPVISAVQNPICIGGATVISVSPYDPNCTYTWYCNGLVVGNGPSINAIQKACYWVEVFDGCFIQTSNPLNLEVCEIVPIIECPQDNPCACLGVPITLIGCNSYNSCGNTGSLPLSYSWSASPGGLTGTGCQFVHTPDPGGTTYTLTVTDPNTGCTATSPPFFINPCQ